MKSLVFTLTALLFVGCAKSSSTSGPALPLVSQAGCPSVEGIWAEPHLRCDSPPPIVQQECIRVCKKHGHRCVVECIKYYHGIVLKF